MPTKQLDYLVEVARLMDALRVEGFESEADRRGECVDAGSTGTEILMAVRHALLGLLSSKLALSDVTAARARQVITGIGSLLSE